MGVDYNVYGTRDKVTDVIKIILFGAFAYGYCLGVLMLISFVSMSKWQVTFAQLLIYAIAPGVLFWAAYIVHLVRKRIKEEKTRRYLRE